MANRFYLFVDESGDPGDITIDNSNSSYYAELALQVSRHEFYSLCEHIIGWKYVRGRFQEVKKLPRGKDSNRYLIPIVELHRQGIIKCSCVYLDKRNYTGPYLKTTPYAEANPLKFRNFIHRQLFEFHFNRYPVGTGDIEIVFDRFEMSKESLDNLDNYLRNNWNLPTFKYITHVDSIYCETLQLTGQLVNAVKDFKLGTITNELRKMMRFLPIKDIT